MKDTELQARLTALGMPPAKARDLTRKIRDELHPVAAVAAVKLANAKAGGQGLSGNTGTAVSFGSAGAKAGSMIVPGIGTAIGAAVGVVAGLLMHKGQKPQRAADAAKVMADLSAFPDNISGGQVPWEVFGHMWYGEIINQGVFGYQSSHPANHPSAMDNMYTWSVDMSKKAIAAGLQAGPGRQVNLPLSGFQGVSFNVVFTTPTSMDETAWANQVVIPTFVAWATKTNPAASVNADVAKPLLRKYFKLLAGRILADQAPASTPTVSTQMAQSTAAVVPASIVNQATAVAQQVAQGGVRPQLVTPIQPPAVDPSFQTYQQFLQPGQPAPTQAVIPWGASQNFAPTQTSMPATTDATAGILQTLLSAQQGANFITPQGQNLVADVAAQGVQKTQAGPSSIPSWAIPAGIAAAVIGAVFLLKRK